MDRALSVPGAFLMVIAPFLISPAKAAELPHRRSWQRSASMSSSRCDPASPS